MTETGVGQVAASSAEGEAPPAGGTSTTAGTGAWWLRGLIFSVVVALAASILWVVALLLTSVSYGPDVPSDRASILAIVLGAASTLIMTIPLGLVVGFLVLLPIDRAVRSHPRSAVRWGALAAGGAAAGAIALLVAMFDGPPVPLLIGLSLVLAGAGVLAGYLADRRWAQRPTPVLVLVGAVIALAVVGWAAQYL